jgi:hypothetical protein
MAFQAFVQPGRDLLSRPTCFWNKNNTKNAQNMSDQLTKRDTDYAQWYNDLVLKADMAEHSEVRGCMVIKPHGYAIWEKMQGALDGMFKATGHVNAYFPLFIPKSYLAKEASHVEGFAKECAVVTHYRLKSDPEKGIIVDPDAKLEEELIIRPTSETIIWNTYRGWIKSYRDLPLLINQWANVVRWECARDCSCARPSSFGRKATPRMLPNRRPRKRPAHVGSLCHLRGGMDGHAGDQRCEDGKRTLRRRRGYLLHRGHDAGRKEPASRHLALSWGRISPKPSTCCSPTRRTSRNMFGPAAGA